MFFKDLYNEIGELLIFNVILMCFGIIYVLFCPEKPNIIFGYRTEKAMSSIENWKEANQHASRSFLLFSIISLGVTFFLYGMSKIIGLNIDRVEIVAWIITFTVPVLSIIYTEIKLKKHNNDN